MTAILLPVAHREQVSEAECVAVCVAMVLDYIGINASYERVMQILQTKEWGTVVSRIQALEQLGVLVIYKQGTFAELQTHLSNNHPPIAFVATRELPYWNGDEQHAVVVVGLDDNYIYLNDPAFPTPAIPVSRGDFDLAWLEWDELYAVLMRR